MRLPSRSSHTLRRAVLLATAASTLTGCDVDFRGLGGLVPAILCAFDFGYDSNAIDSDLGTLRALMECEPNADCADRRTVIVGSSFQFVIEVPMSMIVGTLSVHSTDDAVASLSGYGQDYDTCDDAAQLVGSVRFPSAGEAAVVVSVDGVELDRFTVSAHEPARVDIQAAPDFAWYGAGYETVDSLSVDTFYSLRALVRSESGERLVGATDFAWQLGDSELADFGGAPESQAPLLFPRAVGTTTLRVEAHGLTREIPLEVTAVPDYDDPDAGLWWPGQDGGVGDEP